MNDAAYSIRQQFINQNRGSIRRAFVELVAFAIILATCIQF